MIIINFLETIITDPNIKIKSYTDPYLFTVGIYDEIDRSNVLSNKSVDGYYIYSSPNFDIPSITNFDDPDEIEEILNINQKYDILEVSLYHLCETIANKYCLFLDKDERKKNKKNKKVKSNDDEYEDILDYIYNPNRDKLYQDEYVPMVLVVGSNIISTKITKTLNKIFNKMGYSVVVSNLSQLYKFTSGDEMVKAIRKNTDEYSLSYYVDLDDPLPFNYAVYKYVTK